MDLSALLQAFVAILPAELPDKSMFATIVLVTRFHRPLLVWLGVVGAFALHVVVAVAAGSLLGLLPEDAVQVGVALLFAVGAVLLWRSGSTIARDEATVEHLDLDEPAVGPSAWRIVATSFGVIAVAEWGDLTQLATASLAARSGEPVATALGAWLALAAVAGIAAAFGRQLVRRIPLHRVNYVGATIFAVLSLWTVIDLLA
ncbi:MAG: TMEM165/GDT1 family protein [Acidimicrobiales bacterium]|nr:TMEM165/GDT1 family protein [Acidimicrobiales bacterium]